MATTIGPEQTVKEAVNGLTEADIPPLPGTSSIPQGYTAITVAQQVGIPLIVPEGTIVRTGPDGNLYWLHAKTPEAIGGEKILVWRRIALSLDEAREKRIDFFHPTLGLIWNGHKLAKDRTPEDIMRDTSIGGMVPRGELPVEAIGYAPDAEPAHS